MSYDERTELLVALREFLASGAATEQEQDAAEQFQSLLAGRDPASIEEKP